MRFRNSIELDFSRIQLGDDRGRPSPTTLASTWMRYNPRTKKLAKFVGIKIYSDESWEYDIPLIGAILSHETMHAVIGKILTPQLSHKWDNIDGDLEISDN